MRRGRDKGTDKGDHATSKEYAASASGKHELEFSAGKVPGESLQRPGQTLQAQQQAAEDAFGGICSAEIAAGVFLSLHVFVPRNHHAQPNTMHKALMICAQLKRRTKATVTPSLLYRPRGRLGMEHCSLPFVCSSCS